MPWVFYGAVGFGVAFAVAHIFILPIGITYDGIWYIDLSDILASARFPRDWHPARTPLYPLLLKLTFYLLGRQPLAAIFASTFVGTAAVVLLGYAARRIAGDLVGSAVVVLLTLYPTAIAYQHLILLEAGTMFFLALFVVLLMWRAAHPGAQWLKTTALILALSLGYYWRQALLPLASVVAALHVFANISVRRSPVAWATSLLQAAAIILLPTISTTPWNKYSNRQELTKMALKAGLLRQAVLDPDSPDIDGKKEQYQHAIAQTVAEGGLVSGLRSDLFEPLQRELHTPRLDDQPQVVLREIIVSRPGIYVAALGRTLALFAGVKGLESENAIYRGMILAPPSNEAVITDGPPDATERVRQAFRQSTTPSLTQRGLRVLARGYDRSLILASLATVASLCVGIVRRNTRLVTVSAVPLAYLVFSAVGLASIDRYAFPAYPLLLTNLSIMVAIVFTWVRERYALAGNVAGLAMVLVTLNGCAGTEARVGLSTNEGPREKQTDY